MNQSSIKLISRVQSSESNTLSKTPPSVPSDTVSQTRLMVARQEKAQAETKNEIAEIDGLENVSIHFRVDDKTDNVTVFLVDRKTRKVLRSIPADELQKLQIADLLKLTA